MTQEEDIFAAEMDYGPAADDDDDDDDWAEDEANIMLLARDVSELDGPIDPALRHF
jgi:hypothetical protein